MPGFAHFWKGLRAAALTAAVLVPLAPAAGGCAAQLSEIEQGRAISTGKAPYDEFFAAVRATRDESLSAGEQTDGARAELARALGTEVQTDTTATLDAARARAAKLQSAGVLLHIELVPEPKLVSTPGRRSLDASDKAVLDAMLACVKGSLDVAKRHGALSKRASELDQRRASLQAEVNTTFAGDPRRRQVARELEAAGRVLHEAAQLGDRYAGIASKFVLDLADAVETGAPSRDGAPRRPPSRRSPAGPEAKPRSAGAAARPRPPPAAPAKPHGGDDFDP